MGDRGYTPDHGAEFMPPGKVEAPVEKELQVGSIVQLTTEGDDMSQRPGPGDMATAAEDQLKELHRVIEQAVVFGNRNRVLKEIYYTLDGKESLTADDIHDIMVKIEEVIEVKEL